MSFAGARPALIQTCAGIRVAWTNDDICRFVAPRDNARSQRAEGRGCPQEQIGRVLRTVVVEWCEEVGRPLCPSRLHLHPNERPGDDEKKRASPGYENANGRVNVQHDPS